MVSRRRPASRSVACCRSRATPARRRSLLRPRGRDMGEPGVVHPPFQHVRAIIQRALDEDIGWGDVTTDHGVPADQWSRGVLLAKQDGVLCGGRVFAETLAMVDPSVTVDLVIPDGAAVGKGDVAARIQGPTR